MSDLTRRQVLAGAATVATVAALSPEALAGAPSDLMLGPELLPVPAALDPKVYTTERVGISRATHDAHFRLFVGYANRTNQIRTALKNQAASTTDPNQIFSQMRSLKVNYAFAYGGYLNHLVYFETLGGKGGKPTGAVLSLIEASYGSWDNWLNDFRATALSARGWVFIARDRLTGRIFNYMGDSQETFPMWDSDLLLACDVYEHAFWTDFPGRRGDYVNAWLQVIDWDAVEKRLTKALGR